MFLWQYHDFLDSSKKTTEEEEEAAEFFWYLQKRRRLKAKRLARYKPSSSRGLTAGPGPLKT